MIDFRNKTALITGASSGIGRGFADALAACGARLVLVARSTKTLESVAKQLKKAHGTDARVVTADLSREKSADAVYKAVKKEGLSVDLLINNAGFGTHGQFHTLSIDVDHQEIMLNCVALVRLTHLFIPGMVERADGMIINVASTAAFQPTPYMAVYGATKAFVLSFSEALWAEYKKRNIRVLALCPGATETNFFSVVGTEDAAVGKKRTVQDVVATAFRALERGKPYVIDGLFNYLLAQSSRFATHGQTAMITAGMMKPN